jgi:two-component system, cell cycle response regulator
MKNVSAATVGVSAPPDFTTDLFIENQSLRTQLDQILNAARHNQAIMLRHQALDLKMIAAASFRELLENIFNTLAAESDLDMVTLCLFDRGNSISQILTSLKIDAKEFPHLQLIKHESDLQFQFNIASKPTLAQYDAKLHGRLFWSCVQAPRSIAVVPLCRQNMLIGYLNFGSKDGARFVQEMATDFIERMASIIAISLENVINNERLTLIGLTDPLTNVNNRRYVEQRILEELGRARRQQYSVSCLYLDIDFFKKINDTHGHQGGDDVLIETANRIKAELRLSDTLGRFGGEEFVVLLINSDQNAAMHVAERIRKSIEQKPFLLSLTGICQATISIGAATLTYAQNHGEVTEVGRKLIMRADEGLYQAKNTGRNRVCVAG